ncbi:hypothetical protein FQZ97_866050 [compost metagenome]
MSLPQDLIDYPAIHDQGLNTVGRDGFELGEVLLVAAGGENLGRPHCECADRCPNTQRAGAAVDRHSLTGLQVGFAQAGIGRANISKPRSGLIADVIRQFDQIARRRGHVLAETAIGVILENFHRPRAEAEVAHEGVRRAIHIVTGAARPAASTGQTRVHIDAIARLDVLTHSVPDSYDNAGRVQAIDCRQVCQWQKREPLGEMLNDMW